MEAKLKRKLDATGFPYRVDGDGDGVLIFEVDGGRTQQVWIDQNTDKFHDYEDWDIYSPVCRIPDPENLPPVVGAAFLKKNGSMKAGAFMLRGDMLMFKVDVSTDISPEALRAVLYLIASTADEHENLFTDGGDNF